MDQRSNHDHDPRSLPAVARAHAPRPRSAASLAASASSRKAMNTRKQVREKLGIHKNTTFSSQKIAVLNGVARTEACRDRGSVDWVKGRRSGHPLDHVGVVRRSRTSIKKGRIERNGRPLIAKAPQPCWRGKKSGK